MLKRLPLLLFIGALIFLLAAVYLRFVDGNDSTQDTDNSDTDIAQIATDVPTVAPTITPTDTPVPTAQPTFAPPPVEETNQPIPGQYTEAVVGEISKINPLFAEFNSVDKDITSLIFEGLVDTNEFGEIVPDLAERWATPDGVTYIFVLRRDVLWHDGIQFTTADVKFTIDTIRSPGFEGDQSLSAFWRTVEMTVIDDYTIRFRLVQPLASFPEYLKMGMLPLHVFEGFPVANLSSHLANLDPIGTGPYQKEDLLSANGKIAGITLRVAPTYRQRNPDEPFNIDRLIIRTFDSPEAAVAAYLEGEVNGVAHIPTEFATRLVGANHVGIHNTPLPAVGVLIYNWQDPELAFFQDQGARLGLARSINREQTVATSMGSMVIPAKSPIVLGSWAYKEYDYPIYDVSQAQQNIDNIDFSAEIPAEEASEGDTETSDEEEASEEAASRTMRRNFTILVINEPAYTALADEIASQWAEIGFTVSVDAVDRATYRDRLQNNDFDTAIVEYNFQPYADPDPYTFWHIGQFEDGLNYGGMSDLRISEVLEKARRETVGINRVGFYHQFQEFFAERVPALPLYYPLFTYVVDNRLDGVQLGFISSPADRFRTLQDWRWDLE